MWGLAVLTCDLGEVSDDVWFRFRQVLSTCGTACSQKHIQLSVAELQRSLFSPVNLNASNNLGCGWDVRQPVRTPGCVLNAF